MTRKNPNRLPGSCVWLIGGEGRPRQYFLRKVFLVDRFEPVQGPDFFYRIAGEQGVHFQPPIEITFYPWFEQMKYYLANFSLGLTEITHSYAPALISLAHDLSSEYRQAAVEGWLQLSSDSR